MKQSPLFTLNWNDAIKGLIMAVGTSAAFVLQQSLDAGKLDFDWKKIGMAAIAGGLTYLIKNFLTPSDPAKDIAKENK